MTHLLHLYTGDGKGKTTAAMGLAVRAIGHGQRVLVAQFLKDGQSGELGVLSSLPGCTVYRDAGVAGFATLMNEQDRQSVQHQETALADALAAHLSTVAYDMVVLDELAIACAMGCVPQEGADMLLTAALRFAETVVTGRNAPEWLRARADYLTECTAVKHPYERGIPAREGVEW